MVLRQESVGRGPVAVPFALSEAEGRVEGRGARLRIDLREPVPAPEVAVSYFDLGVEPSLRHELTRGRGVRVHVRAGWRWRWLIGDTEVERLCSFHGGCDGGYYDQTPTYAASGPVLAVGVGGRTAGDYWAGFGAELAVAHAVVDRPGMDPDLDDVLVTLGLNVALGRGAH